MRFYNSSSIKFVEFSKYQRIKTNKIYKITLLYNISMITDETFIRMVSRSFVVWYLCIEENILCSASNFIKGSVWYGPVRWPMITKPNPTSLARLRAPIPTWRVRFSRHVPNTGTGELMNDYCWTFKSKWPICFSYISGENKLILMRWWWWWPLWNRPTRRDTGIFYSISSLK